VAVCGVVNVSVIVTVYVAIVLGVVLVPLITPEELYVNPVGNVGLTVKLSVPYPPVAVIGIRLLL
jgi:hypothetical protein